MARNASADVNAFFATLFASLCAAAALAAFLLYMSWRYLTGPTVGAGVALAAALRHAQVTPKRAVPLALLGMVLVSLVQQAVSEESAPTETQLDVPVTVSEPSLRLLPPTPPSPPSCWRVCLVSAFGPAPVPVPPTPLALLVNASFRLPGEAAAAALEALGPPGSFMRDFWAVLLPLGIVACVAFASLSRHCLTPLLRPVLRVLVTLRAASMVACLVVLGTLCLGAAALVAQRAWLLTLHSAPRLYLRALLHAAPAGPAAQLGVALVSAAWRGTGWRGVGEGGSEHLWRTLLLACAGVAAAAGCVARELVVVQEEPARSAAQVGLPLSLLRRLQRVETLDASGPEPRLSCGTGSTDAHALCAGAWCAVAVLAAWMALGVLTRLSGSAALRALFRAPLVAIRIAARLAVSVARAAWRSAKGPLAALGRAALAAGRALGRAARAAADAAAKAAHTVAGCVWRHRRGLAGTTLAACGAVLLGAAELHAVWWWAAPAAVPPSCASAAHFVYADVVWGGLPLLRLAGALSRRSGACGRAVLRAAVGTACAAGGGELVGREFGMAEARLLLSAPVAAVLRLIATPPPLPVKLVRDGVLPVVIGCALLLQAAAPLPPQDLPPPLASAPPLFFADNAPTPGQEALFGLALEVPAALALVLAGVRTLRNIAALSPALVAAGLAARRAAVSGAAIACRGVVAAWRCVVAVVARAVAAAQRLGARLLRLMTTWLEILLRLAASLLKLVYASLLRPAWRTATSAARASSQAPARLGRALARWLPPRLGWVLGWWPAVSAVSAAASCALFARAAAVAAASASPAAAVCAAAGCASAASIAIGAAAVVLPSAAPLRRVSRAASLLLGRTVREAVAGVSRAAAWAGTQAGHAAALVYRHLLAAPLAVALAAARAVGAALAAMARSVATMAHVAGRVLWRGAVRVAWLCILPLRVVWRRPGLMLAASAAAVVALWSLHSSGSAPSPAAILAPVRRCKELAVTPLLAVAHATSALGGGTLAAVSFGGLLLPAAVEVCAPALAWTAAVLEAAGTEAGGVAAAFGSAGALYTRAVALHAQPAFGALVWLLVAAVAALSDVEVPPRALAAVQLALLSKFFAASGWLVIPVMGLAVLYLWLSANAAAAAARERRQAAHAFAQLPARRRREGIKEALAQAEAPSRVFASDDCVICMEALPPDAARVLRCGHTFHPDCIAEWCARASHAPRCPTCMQPIHWQRAALDQALLVD